MDAVFQFWHAHHDLCINIVAGLIVVVLLWLISKFRSGIIALLRQLISPPAPAPPQQIVVNIPAPQSIPSPPAEKPAAEPSSHPAPGAFLPRPPAVGFVDRQDRQGHDFVALLKAELAPSERQFVVLSGSGGVGKSALAGEVARQLESAFDGRVIWSTADGRADYSLSGLLDEIASRLGDQEVRKLAMEPKKQRVAELLAAGCALVVLDNFETIPLAEQALCAQWLAHDAPCAVLVTSREGIEGAHNISTDPMLSKEAEEFLARLIAQATHPAAFEKLDRARIMTAAESTPLLMEWLVGQIDLAQNPEQVLTDLKKGKGTAAQRIFDRSFSLPQVGDDGRAVLLALSLFAPDALREALAEVAGFGRELDRLNEAVKHLAALRLVSSTLAAKRLVIEGLTREMASARLAESGRQLEFRERFIDFFEGYAGQHAETKPEDFQALESEKENLLRAMATAWDLHRWNDVMNIRSSLEDYLDLRGYWEEAIRTGELALQAARNAKSQLATAQFTHNLAVVYQRKGDLARAKQLCQESLEIAKKLDYQSGIGSCLHLLAIQAQDQGNPEEAHRLYQASLEIAKKLGDQSGIAISLHQLAMLAQDQGNPEEARRLDQESLGISKKLGDQRGIASSLHQLAILAQDQGNPEEARRLDQESLEILKKLGDQSGIAASLHQLAILAQNQGNPDEARRLDQESLEIKKKLGDQGGIAASIHHLGTLAQDQGDPEEARRLYQESQEILKKLGDQSGIAKSLHQLAMLAQDQGDPEEARRFYQESQEIAKKLGDQSGIASSLHQLGTLAHEQGNPEEARRLYQESLKILKKLGDQSGIAISLHQLGTLAQDQGNPVEARRLYQESLEIAKKLGDQSGIALSLCQLGRLSEKEGDASKAAGYYREALRIFEALHSPYAEVARRDLARVEGKKSGRSEGKGG